MKNISFTIKLGYLILIQLVICGSLWGQEFIGTRLLGSFQDFDDVMELVFDISKGVVERGMDIYYFDNDTATDELLLLKNNAEQYIISNTNHRLFELWQTMFRLEPGYASVFYIWFSDSIRGGFYTFHFVLRENRTGNPQLYY